MKEINETNSEEENLSQGEESDIKTKKWFIKFCEENNLSLEEGEKRNPEGILQTLAYTPVLPEQCEKTQKQGYLLQLIPAFGGLLRIIIKNHKKELVQLDEPEKRIKEIMDGFLSGGFEEVSYQVMNGKAMEIKEELDIEIQSCEKMLADIPPQHQAFALEELLLVFRDKVDQAFAKYQGTKKINNGSTPTEKFIWELGNVMKKDPRSIAKEFTTKILPVIEKK